MRKASVYRKLFKSISFFLLSCIFLLFCTYCSTKSYDPYSTNEKKGKPDYDGREKNRFFSTDRYTTPPLTIVEKNKFSGKAMPEGEQLEPPVDNFEFEPEANYQLGPGDMLEIIYQLKAEKRNEDYLLRINDEVEISFFYTPKMNRKVVVQSDGNITMPLIGDVQVYAKSAHQVEGELRARYSGLLKDPEIEVLVVKSNWAIEELKRAITTAPRGQSRLEPVRPDGFISLPLIGDALIGGLTVPQAASTIKEKYKALGVLDIDVTVVLLEVRASVVNIFGEVMKPGQHVIQERDDIWRVIAQAGGFTPDADKSHVIVAKYTKDKQTRFVLDFEKWRNQLDSTENTIVRRGDVIYIPKLKDRFVYLLGAIEKPGRINLDLETGMTASQAVALGGRIKAGANESQILVLRKSPVKDPIVISVDLNDVVNPKNYNDKNDYPPRDPYLQPGDIIFVPNSFIGDVDRFAEAYFRDGIWTIIPFNVTATYSLN